jgi:hypothetical protein
MVLADNDFREANSQASREQWVRVSLALP